MKPVLRWIPAALLLTGVVVTTTGARTQREMELERPLDEVVAREFLGWQGRDIEISEEEQAIAGMSSYVLRIYEPAGVTPQEAAAAGFSVYVGYYPSQAQGQTIHSPKNCLPGGGWEPLVSSRETIETQLGPIQVNQYLIGNGPAQAAVLYWYQGRGRVEANEYAVKWHLLRDQAVHGRSDEALVRVIVPVDRDATAAFERAVEIAKQLVLQVDAALPPA